MKRLKIGIVGCGKICDIYLKNCTTKFDMLEVYACADLMSERAQAKAQEYNVPHAYSVDELLEDPEVDIVLNLTVPKVHFEINMKALEAEKHVYVEKPLALTVEDGQKIMETARAKGLLVGCAPDTFLGAGIQTCMKLIDDGWIGTPVAAAGFMMGRGPEGWHPSPDFFYQFGGGPMFDMGPYYLTAMVSLLGPVRRITGSTHISFPERKITSEKRYGERIPVEIPTHIAGVLDFENGAVGTLITSFDIFGGHTLPKIEVYGTQGSLKVPDPNTFGGPVLVKRSGAQDWQEVPLAYEFSENSRGLGLADMANAIIEGRHHRANGELAYHVLELMQGFHEASREERHYKLSSTCKRPQPFALGMDPRSLL